MPKLDDLSLSSLEFKELLFKKLALMDKRLEILEDELKELKQK